MRGFRGRFLAVLLLTFTLTSAKDKPKPAKVELKDFKVAVDGSHVNIDGIVHNAGERTIENLVLYFHFLDSDHQPVTTLRLDVDDESIDPDEDAEIHAAANEPPRSVSVNVTASAHGEKELTVVNPGPYQIE
jgi:hypothetical protein